MMAGRPILVITVFVQACLLVQWAQAHRKPDCSYISGFSSFHNYDELCSEITSPDSNLPKLNQTEKWDLIETCACNLIAHDVAWNSMVTQEVDVFYASIEKYINEKDEEAIRENRVAVPKSNPMFAGPDGMRMYYWDRLADIMRNLNEEEDQDQMAFDLMEIFAKTYTDMETFEKPFANAPDSQTLRQFLSESCSILVENFAGFLRGFDKLRRLAQNDRLMFKLTSYNPELHKIRNVLSVCDYLDTYGQLVYDDE